MNPAGNGMNGLNRPPFDVEIISPAKMPMVQAGSGESR